MKLKKGEAKESDIDLKSHLLITIGSYVIYGFLQVNCGGPMSYPTEWTYCQAV